MSATDYERQAAHECLFERRPLNYRRTPEAAASGFQAVAVLVAGNRPPHGATRSDERVIGGRETPTLTITSDPGYSIVVAGANAPDWSLFFHAVGRGQTEAEASEQLRQRSFVISGSTVSLTGPHLSKVHDASGELLVEAPNGAGVVIHASYTAAEVRDMTGPVRIAATHARAVVLNTTGNVDVSAGVIDFAGAAGRVTLSAESEINLKMTAREFHGTLLAWAQRSVRMLIPPEFTTPLEIVVASRDNFVCRVDLLSNMKHKRQGELHVFTYAMNPDDSSRPALRLRSEQSTVVIDRTGGNL